jgi:hypothetical protein
VPSSLLEEAQCHDTRRGAQLRSSTPTKNPCGLYLTEISATDCAPRNRADANRDKPALFRCRCPIWQSAPGLAFQSTAPNLAELVRITRTDDYTVATVGLWSNQLIAICGTVLPVSLATSSPRLDEWAFRHCSGGWVVSFHQSRDRTPVDLSLRGRLPPFSGTLGPVA